MKSLITLFLLLGLVPMTAQSQALGGNEYIAGAALNGALRAPFVAQNWRRPVPRLVLATAVSVAYERFIDANWNRPDHEALSDLRGRFIGCATVELVIALVRTVAP